MASKTSDSIGVSVQAIYRAMHSQPRSLVIGKLHAFYWHKLAMMLRVAVLVLLFAIINALRLQHVCSRLKRTRYSMMSDVPKTPAPNSFPECVKQAVISANDALEAGL